MESQIKYDLEADLSAPPGGVLKSILVTVELEPKDAGCLIYGTMADGNMSYVEVRGAKSEIELPFAHPHIYVKYLSELENIKISTRGWKNCFD